jgi:hypothetical protein
MHKDLLGQLKKQLYQGNNIILKNYFSQQRRRNMAVNGFEREIMPRRTEDLVKNWFLVENWHIAPQKFIEEIGAEYTLKDKTKFWNKRLAHRCDDGSIRSPRGFMIYNKTRGGTSIYGCCSGCKAPIPDEVKTIIKLEEF